MERIDPLTLLIIAANGIVSYLGFNNRSFFERNLFEVGRVLGAREYHRLLVSGFLHVDWTHLLFNMISFYSFNMILVSELGPVKVLVIYFASLLGGDLLALFIHRNHRNYRAVGASGAVSGIIFSAIALFPGIKLLLFVIPNVPGWLFGIIYVLYSIYGIRSRTGNIGHEAHLGGALIGMAVTVAMEPRALEVNMWVILLIAVPCIIFIAMIATRPNFLNVRNPFASSHGAETIDDQYNAHKQAEQREINKILEKIGRHGVESLTEEEKDKLNRFSGRK